METAILNINALQVAELENYLGCELPTLNLVEGIDDPNAAIVYPIMLEDRLAVIFEIPNAEQPSTLSYWETPIPRETVDATLKGLRANLAIAHNTPEVIDASQQVYQWLIQPLEPFLEASDRVETLVFVLDGALRNIPMAVLHDGERYLVEQGYGLAVAPRLELFSPRASSSPEIRVATGGVSIPQVIEGTPFPAIEKVGEELSRIAERIDTSEPLLDANFTAANIQQQLQAGTFSAIHWKTHGVFSSDPQETFLVAFNERITAKDLNAIVQTSIRKGTQPLELLVLSACETALGDDRAVLGLAGIAARTGARSVLATLWTAQDEPNTEFMARFYEELSKPGVTKARALQQAQLALIQKHGYTTPYIWANYTLVGNWL
ncbi:MAG: CHAT domain-containing protein [Cyanobacteria bacterium J06641_5]